MLFYEQVEQLHHLYKEWKLEAKDPVQQTEANAQEKTQTRIVDSSTAAPSAEDQNEAEANASPTVAEAKLSPELDIEPTRHKHRTVVENETPPGSPKVASLADADSLLSSNADAAFGTTTTEQTNRTESAHFDLPRNTCFLNVQASTVPSFESANTVIPTSATPTSATSLPPPPAVEAMKGNRQITPTMRTAPPRKSQGSMGRGDQGIGKVSSMITAN